MLMVGTVMVILLGTCHSLFITYQTTGISEIIFTVTFEIFCKWFKSGIQEQKSMYLHSSENGSEKKELTTYRLNRQHANLAVIKDGVGALETWLSS